jgi:uncharacterized membrane protein (UPF0127 family)
VTTKASAAEPKPSSPPTPRATARASAADADRCVVPLADPGAPPAKAAKDCPKDPEPSPPVLSVGSVTFPEAPGAPAVEVELANTPPAVQRGLMYRKSLGEKRGMLFVFEDVRPRTFWMKNTCIPLDMLFLASDGTIAGILEQVPVLNEDPRDIPCPAAYVLEVNAGYARRHGVKPGMKAEIKL